MPIDFATDLHRYVYEKVRCFLFEAPEIADVAAMGDAPAFLVGGEDERVTVAVTPASSQVVVTVSAALPAALGADAAWLREALAANAADGLPGVALDPEGAPYVSYALLGVACTRAALVASIYAVGSHAAALAGAASA